MPNQQFNDVDIITDILTTQKSLMSRYTVALSEGSQPKLRTLFENNLSEVATDQYDAFRYMNDRNLYPVEAAPKEKIKESQTKFKDKQKEMK